MNGSGANVAGCANCAGNCCRTYKVEVTVADVRRLAAGTSLHPTDFIRLMDDEDGFRLGPGGPGKALFLIRRPESGACVFLMELAPGKARCGVYAHRPLVCSNFPTILRRNAVDIRQDVVCGPDSWNLAAMDVTTYRQDLTRNRAAWREHREIVETWNETIDAKGRKASHQELFDYFLDGRVEG